MNPESFVERVSAIRSQWQDRRDLRHTAGSLFDAQYLLLLKLYGWAGEATEAIQAVYGEQAPCMLGPSPDRDDHSLSFQVSIGTSHVLTIALIESSRGGNSQWRIRANMSFPNSAGPVAVAPTRRTSSWTRRELEDVLLGLLNAYEREQL
jgi:hypothetical protein